MAAGPAPTDHGRGADRLTLLVRPGGRLPARLTTGPSRRLAIAPWTQVLWTARDDAHGQISSRRAGIDLPRPAVQAPPPETTHTAAVLRGRFNPQIFQPAWVAAQGLIRGAEAEAAEIAIIHPEVVAYSLDWARVEVERETLVIRTTSKTEAPEQVRDLALGMIRILSHTPIYGVGIQFAAHYPMADESARDELLDLVVPQTSWDRMLESPALASLTMQGERINRDIGRAGNALVTVEPSRKLLPHGIYIAVAEQYEVADPKQPALGSQAAHQALDAIWQTSAAGADSTVSSIFDLYAASR